MPSDRKSSMELEIIREQAQALGSTGIDLEDLLRQLYRLDLAITETCGKIRRGGKRQKQLARYFRLGQLISRFNQKRIEAIGGRLNLIIQREALGFRRHLLVFNMYAIPEAKTAEAIISILQAKEGDHES